MKLPEGHSKHERVNNKKIRGNENKVTILITISVHWPKLDDASESFSFKIVRFF